MRINAALAAAVERLTDSSESPRLDAEILLCRSIDVARSYVFAHPDDELDALSLSRFDTLVQRRAAGEPMAYITGTREFWSRELLVSPATLVPRPETELLVDLALRDIPRKAEWRILDLGTGSGAIAIAIAGERPLCDVTATDISADALAIARLNVREAGLGNVECIQGDWTAAVAGRQFELIVSNPPYVRADDEVLRTLRFEPVSALAAGPDGLDDIRTLVRGCPAVLVEQGRLLIEHGAEQADAVASILDAVGWTEIRCHSDLAGLPRVTAARLDGKQART